MLAKDYVSGRTHGVEEQEDFIAFHQSAHLLQRLGRHVSIVEADQVDLAPVNAAFGINLGEIGLLRMPNLAVHGERPAVRHGLADLYLSITDAGIIILFCGGCLRNEGKSNQECDEPEPMLPHVDLPSPLRAALLLRSRRKS